MIPIQDLLYRILWDKEFGKGDFQIGYYDRIKDEIIIVPFTQIQFTAGDHFSFQVYDSAEIISIPLHRVRLVKKDGHVIWRRTVEKE